MRQFETLLLFRPEFFRWFWNSVLIVGSVLLFNIPVSLLAGYGFSQFTFPMKKYLYFLYILLMILPFQATMIPQYLTLKFLGIIGTRASLIWPNVFSTLGVFLITQYMTGINVEILDAGRVEGLSEMAVFSRLALPISRPAIASLGILLFLDCWSMIEQPIAFLRDSYLFPLSAELTLPNFGVALSAAGVLISILPVTVYLLGRSELDTGIELSGVK